jgi:hypothetical protein
MGLLATDVPAALLHILGDSYIQTTGFPKNTKSSNYTGHVYSLFFFFSSRDYMERPLLLVLGGEPLIFSILSNSGNKPYAQHSKNGKPSTRP